jgi:hypothetical protein
MNIYTIWTIVFVLAVLHIVSASMLINHTRSCQDTSRRARDQTYATIILVLSVLSSLSLGILMYNNPPPPGVVNIMAPVRKIFPTK